MTIHARGSVVGHGTMVRPDDGSILYMERIIDLFFR
jgi:hypothetical protein